MSNIPGDFGVHSKALKAAHNRLFTIWLIEKFGQTYLRTGLVDVAGGNGGLSFELSVRYGINCILIEPRHVELSSVIRKRMQKITEQRSSESPNAPYQNPKHAKHASDDAFVLEMVWDAIYKESLPFKHIQTEFHFINTPILDPVLVDVLNSSVILVGIHPDQATESVIDAALYFNKSFAVVPCCVFPNLFPQRYISKEVRDINSEMNTVNTVNTVSTLVRTYDDFITYLCNKDKSILIDYLPFEGRNIVLYRKVV